MSEERNRVIEGMQEWKAKEQNIADLFSPDALKTVYFQKLKLDYLHELKNDVKKNPSKEEKMVLRMLRGEVGLLERKIYQNKIVRFFVRLGRVVKNLNAQRVKQDFETRTNWMLKVDSGVMKKAQQNKNGNNLSVVQKHARERPVLLQKNRMGFKKGQRIK